MKSELPQYNNVFFVHYQCDDFNKSEEIESLCIYSNGKAKEYSGNEVENIKEYAAKVNELLSQGLILVHWNQDRPYYGIDHINNRYKDLTDDNLELKYSDEINLAEWLIFKYGQNYIKHPRLDELAKLNEFYGIREGELGQRTFAINRIMLLTKIYFNSLNDTLKIEIEPSQQTETKTEQGTIEMKPVLKPEAVQIVFEIIKDFFSTEQQAELKQILETGNKASSKLLFMDNANRLTDTFKKLIEHDFITGCQKQYLESWIVSNFLFLHNGTPKDFKPKVVNKYVSAGKKTVPCKSPLIEIIDGQIRKAEQPRTKKYSKY